MYCIAVNDVEIFNCCFKYFNFDLFVKKKSLIKNCIGMDIDTTDIDHPDCSK